MAENSLPPIARRFLDFVIERPKTALFCSLILLGIIVPGAARVKADFSYRVWFHQGDPDLVKFDAFERRFGNDESSVVVMHSPSGIFDKDSATLLNELTEKLWQVPDTIRVDSLANYNWVHAEDDDILVDRFIPLDEDLSWELLASRRETALAHPVLPGYLISRDTKTTALFLALKPSFEGSPDYAGNINGIRKIIKSYENRGDHQFFITGAAAITQAFDESTVDDMSRLVPAVILITMLLLIGIFRSLGGLVLPMIVIFTTIGLTIGIAGWIGIPFSSMTAIIPQFLIAIGIADAVHILVTYFRGRRAGLERKAAARLSLTKNLVPTLLTSLSTAIGFFSFATADLLPLAQLGLLSGVGTLLAWVVTYLIVGPLLVLLPLKVRPIEDAPQSDKTSPLAERMTSAIEAGRKPILISFFLLIAASLFLAAGNVVNSDPFKYFAEDYWLQEANDFIEANIGGSMGPEIVFDAGGAEAAKDPDFLKKVEGFQDWLLAKDYISKTVSIVDVLKSVNRSLHGDAAEAFKLPGDRGTVAQELFLYTMSLPQGMDINDRITLNNDAVRMTALWTKHDSATVIKTLKEFNAKAEEMGLDAIFTGKALLWSGMNPKIVRSFLVSVSLALFLVSALLIYAFGSFRLGLLALLPNVIPLIFGGAFLRILGQPLDIGTTLVTSVCLGIAVDDTIHFLANFNRLSAEGLSPRDAIARILTHTAPALIVTTVVLVAAFGAFAFATFIPNVNFGIMVAFVLTAALVTDLLFLPALLLSLHLQKSPKVE